MNIFYIDSDPQKCAEWAVDKHVVKMILESAQLLSTAHRVLDGQEARIQVPTKTGKNIGKNRWKKIWLLPDPENYLFYQATHINHPCAVWARESNNNYNWLWAYLWEHCKEYTYRYGKIHKIERDGLINTLSQTPHNIPIGYKTILPMAMPDEYKDPFDVIQSYRNYYKYGKSHLHKYTKRDMPDWMKET
jgi:hypothetical protein